MAIKVHCEKCHAKWEVTENLEDVLDVDDGDYTMNALCLYVCPHCHYGMECIVSFDKIPRTIIYHSFWEPSS